MLSAHACVCMYCNIALKSGVKHKHQFSFSFFSFIFISWRLITLQYCSGFCHTLTWISHGVTCIPHPDPPSHLPLHPIPLGLPSAPGTSTCLMHPAWAGELQTPIFKSHCLGFWCSSISNFIILKSWNILRMIYLAQISKSVAGIINDGFGFPYMLFHLHIASREIVFDYTESDPDNMGHLEEEIHELVTQWLKWEKKLKGRDRLTLSLLHGNNPDWRIFTNMQWILLLKK